MNDSIMNQAKAAAVAEAIRPPHPDVERISELESLARRHGRAELRMNDDGTIDVRAGGLSCYHRGLRQATEGRVRAEAAQVSAALAGDTGAQMGDGVMGAYKARTP